MEEIKTKIKNLVKTVKDYKFEKITDVQFSIIVLCMGLFVLLYVLGVWKTVFLIVLCIALNIALEKIRRLVVKTEDEEKGK